MSAFNSAKGRAGAASLLPCTIRAIVPAIQALAAIPILVPPSEELAGDHGEPQSALARGSAGRKGPIP